MSRGGDLEENFAIGDSGYSKLDNPTPTEADKKQKEQVAKLRAKVDEHVKKHDPKRITLAASQNKVTILRLCLDALDSAQEADQAQLFADYTSLAKEKAKQDQNDPILEDYIPVSDSYKFYDGKCPSMFNPKSDAEKFVLETITLLQPLAAAAKLATATTAAEALPPRRLDPAASLKNVM